MPKKRLLTLWGGIGLMLVLLASPLVGACASGELKEFTVEASDFKLSPASITVNQGDRVKITFKNVGQASHNFVIDELGVSTYSFILPGSAATLRFTADQPGTFVFYCSVSGHREAGMKGELIVE